MIIDSIEGRNVADELDEIRDDTAELKSANNNAPAQNDSNNNVNILSELIDRERRAKNIRVYNLLDTNNDEVDSQKLYKILNKHVTFDNDSVTFVRHGDYMKGY